MFESYDVKVRNPYGAKLTTQQLNPGGAFKAVSIAIPAGQQLADHTAPSPAMLFTIEGEARFVAGSEQFPLAPGTVVHIPAGVAHRIEAVQKSHFVLVR
jgi:quercetin dioxygenase-like cupin family protein